MDGSEFLKFAGWLGGGGGGRIRALCMDGGIGDAEGRGWDVGAVGKDTDRAWTGRGQRARDRVEEAERREHK